PIAVSAECTPHDSQRGRLQRSEPLTWRSPRRYAALTDTSFTRNKDTTLFDQCGAASGGVGSPPSSRRQLSLLSCTSPIAGLIRCRHASLQLLRGQQGPDTKALRGDTRRYLPVTVSPWRSATLLARSRILSFCVIPPPGCKRPSPPSASPNRTIWTFSIRSA